MTSKDFFNEVFSACTDTDGVSKLFRSLMNEMCEVVSERNEELESGKTKKATKSAKSSAKITTKVAKSTKVEPAVKTTKAKSTKKSAKDEAPEVEVIKISKRTINKLGLQYVDYNEKSFAIVGNTKPIKEELKSLKGRFNGGLTINGKRTPGWVFAKCNAETVKKSLYIA